MNRQNPPRVALALVGAGQVGRAFLRQLLDMRQQLAEEGRMDLRIVAVARSREMFLSEAILRLEDTESHLHSTVPLDLTVLTSHLKKQAGDGIGVVVDATASSTLPDHYAAWLEAGLHLVTPNKQAGAGPADRWQAIQKATLRGEALFRGEATVGAGLPVLSTLRSLRGTGDEILGIEGVLSGSLAFLIDAWSHGASFSSSLRSAQKLGYLEPDPREDLSGQDVVRKMVILAREAGYDMDTEDVQVQGLVPASLAAGSVDDFWAQNEVLDHHVQSLLHGLQVKADAEEKGSVIRFVGSLSVSSEGPKATVGPQALSASHPFSSLSGTGNAIAFWTRRYNKAPLMIQGPGAGPDVTASGMFSDLLEIVASCKSAPPRNRT